MDRILGCSLALAARALYCSHSGEPETGALLLLATAEAYEKGLEGPALLVEGLRGPSLVLEARGPSWLPWPLFVPEELVDLVGVRFDPWARGVTWWF